MLSGSAGPVPDSDPEGLSRMPSKSLLVSTVALTALAPLAAPLTSSSAAPTAPARSGAAIRNMSVAQLHNLVPRTRRAVAHSRVDASGGYQGQRRCMRGDRPGTVALKRLLKVTYDSSVPIGLSRGCGGDTSEHYDGRALDWMMNSRHRREAAQADSFVDWLTSQRKGVRGANARRLGVMYIIWRGRMWRAYDPGWRDYNGCSRGRGGDPTSCHFDHVHISLTWKGAYKKTSWYRHRG